MHSKPCDTCPRCEIPLHGATDEMPFSWCGACEVGWLGLGFELSIVPARVLAG